MATAAPGGEPVTTAAAEDRDRVGPYRVIKAIGAGGSARIDLARIDRAYGFQRHVVIKRPLEHLRGDPGVAASLRREARIGGQLRHPNLVAILDAGVHDGYDYLVLEYVHGAALRAVMQADAPGAVRDLPLGVALAIVSDAARGMHEAHELTDDRGSPLGLVHRDVSPGNILLGLDGTVKLADFGIAKETRVSTLSGSMHGTVTYMAPEQCQGHAFDRRADVFSLGVILYELVTGTRLFWADNDVASLHRVLSGAVPRPRKVKPQIPAALEEIVMTAVAHDAEQRFATALELATAVERCAASAGEVLGARWIARSVEAVVGPRPVPWIAAAPAPEAAPAADESLVELIAAIGTDEPVEPAFGDAGGADDDDATVTTAPPSPPAAAPVAAARAAPRRRALAAWIAALAVTGSATTAIVMTRGSRAPAVTTAPADPARTPGAHDTGTDRAATPPSDRMTTGDSAARARDSAADRPAPSPGDRTAVDDHAPGPRDSTTDRAVADDHTPGARNAAAADPEPSPSDRAASDDHAPGAPDTASDRPAPSPSDRPAPPRAGGTVRAVPPRTAGEHRPGKRKPRPVVRPAPADPAPSVRPPDSPAPPAVATPGPGSDSAPPARPATRVEWKPTLLLPTDGSDGRERR